MHGEKKKTHKQIKRQGITWGKSFQVISRVKS